MSRSSLQQHDACGIAVVADRRGRASREIVERGLDALCRLGDRAALRTEGQSCSGSGILAAIPWDVVAPELPAALCDPAADRIAAMFALDPKQADRAVVAARSALGRLGWHVMAWRDVPMVLSALAPDRRGEAPRLVQCFARAPRHRSKRTPYRTRLAIESRWLRLGLTGCSVASLSDSTMVYKGLVDPSALLRLYPDLADPRFSSPFAVLHQQVGAQLPPRWDLTQPFHAIAQDGAIETIAGNRVWMNVRINDAGIRDDTDLLKDRGSDSQTLDAAVQWLCELGLSTPHAVTRLLANVWEHDQALPADVHAFRRYESCFAEPWDGPAAVAFADGRYAGAMADRHGVRPVWTVETDGLVCIASDDAIFDVPEAAAESRARLHPGEMLVIDLDAGTVLRGEAVWRGFAAQQDYGALAKRLIHRIPAPATVAGTFAASGVSTDGVSLRTLLGRRGQWTAHGLPPVLVELDSPVLLDHELAAVLGQTDVRAAVLPMGFAASDAGAASSGETLRQALVNLETTAAALAANGTRILVLSDRRLEPGLAPIPPLLATAAVDSGLRAARLRLRASIVVDSAQIRDAQQIAELSSFGASATVPYGLYAATPDPSGDPHAAERRRQALEDGLRTIMLQAGVRSFEAYCGARLDVLTSA